MFHLLTCLLVLLRCGNVAAILEFDENLKQSFRIFEVEKAFRIIVFRDVFI